MDNVRAAMMRWLALLVSISALGQVPVGLMDKKSQPELKAKVYWENVPGASAYKIYEYGSVGGPCPTADSAYVYDDSVTDTWYLDDPNPNWYAIPATNLDAWQHRWWCYEITAIVNGSESARSAPVQIAIGASGYITMAFQKSCTAGGIIPFPYTFAEMEIHLYYRDANGVDHEIGYFPNLGSDFAEVEFKIPVIAKDGTVVPLVEQTGYNGYHYSWKTPDMAEAKADNFMPVYQPDAVTYSQINIRRVQYTTDCPIPWGRPGGNYYWTQNVTR